MKFVFWYIRKNHNTPLKWNCTKKKITKLKKSNLDIDISSFQLLDNDIKLLYYSK